LRTTTLIFGTVASDTAVIIRAPWRMMPSRSTCEPIMKPGTSARKIRGTLKASQLKMKRAALSAESPNSTPPLTSGLLATIPTEAPFIRPNPVMSSGAKRGLVSKKLSASISPSMKPRIE
jgi:hypothetical protein